MTYDPATEDFVWLLRHVTALRPHGDFDIDTVAQVLEEAARLAAGAVAPIAEESDRVGSKLENGRVVTPPMWKDAYAAWNAAGWQGLALPEEHGGMGAPFPVQAALTAMLAGTDLSFAMLLGGSRAGAALIAAHAGEDMKALALPKLASGEWAATIAMTEAQAGTDAGLIQTRAKPLGEGKYALSGSKIFISNGDQDLTEQTLHITLARIEGAEGGTRGLSLFVVPMWKMDGDGAPGAANGVWVSALEEKMGLHGSPTSVLNFDKAEGVLIGPEHSGLPLLFTMLNEMRLDVGLSAVGLAASAVAHARAYAAERMQGRGPDGKGPVAIENHPDVQRMLSLMAALTESGRALAMEAARLIDLAEEGDGTAAALAALLTPVCKAALSDQAFAVASLGVQVMGGHGYVVESGAERFLRDSRVLALYEGANGVQAIDLAVRKVQKDGGAALGALTAAMRADLERLDRRKDLAAVHSAAASAVAELEGACHALIAAETGGAGALAAAYPFLELTAHACQTWMWLRMAGADAPDDAVLARKRALADFWAGYFGHAAEGHYARVRAAAANPEMYRAALS